MVETVDPRVRAGGEVTVLRTDVVRLAEVVPAHDLDEANLVAVGNEVLPARHPEMFVTVVDELS